MRRHALALAVALPCWCCSPSLTPADDAELAAHGATLVHCQELGRAAPHGQHLAVYEACKADAGIQ